MRRISLSVAILAGLGLPAEARACIAHQFFHGVIHDALPYPLPAGLFIADVDFEPEADEGELFRGGLQARIRRVIQGDYRGEILIARSRLRHSCYSPFTNGRAGLFVGVPIGVDDGVLVVRPIDIGRNQGFRLPDGYRLATPAPD